jgi:hypothetical protein
MKLRKRAPRGAVAMLVALTAALGVAACGSSTNNGTTKTTSKNGSATTTKSGSGKGTSQTAFATCLKQHGVTLPKRPAGGFRGGVGGRTGTNAAPPSGTSTTGRRFGPGGGGGFAGGGFAGGNSKFAKALKACGSKLGSQAGRFGGQGFPGGAPRRGQPQFTTAKLKAFVTCVRKNGYAAMPEPNTSGKFPSSVQKNAKFQAASQKCVSILQSGIHAQGQSTTSGSSSAASA